MARTAKKIPGPANSQELVDFVSRVRATANEVDAHYSKMKRTARALCARTCVQVALRRLDVISTQGTDCLIEEGHYLDSLLKFWQNSIKEPVEAAAATQG